MSNRLGTSIGLLILLAGAAGVYVLFREGPAVEEEAEQEVQTVVPVKVAQIRRMTLHDYLRAYGSLVANPGGGDAAPASVRINSPLDGMVTEVHCVAGQEVKKAARLPLPKRNWSRGLDSMRQFARKLFFRCGKLTLSAFGPAKNSSYGGTILFVIV
jgi:hypothetical protein